MKLTLNILLPLGLAIVAGVINYAALSRTTAMQSYIASEADIKPGEPFKMPLLKEVRIAARVPGAIPWDERHVLATLKAPRTIASGDWILRSDVVPQADSGIRLEKLEVALNVSLEGVVIEPNLLKLGQPIGFVIRQGDAAVATSTKTKVNDQTQYQIIGPFRLVTLGEVTGEDMESDEDQQGRPPRTISVAVPSVDGKTLDQESQHLARAIEQAQITAIVLYPHKAETKP